MPLGLLMHGGIMFSFSFFSVSSQAIVTVKADSDLIAAVLAGDLRSINRLGKAHKLADASTTDPTIPKGHIDFVDSKGYTALARAVAHTGLDLGRQRAIIQTLLLFGADPYAGKKGGVSAHLLAKSKPEIFDLFSSFAAERSGSVSSTSGSPASVSEAATYLVRDWK
jgi:hypothetical protein